MAGETGLEPAAYGFGDRHSTIELLPYANYIIQYRDSIVKDLRKKFLVYIIYIIGR